METLGEHDEREIRANRPESGHVLSERIEGTVAGILARLRANPPMNPEGSPRELLSQLGTLSNTWKEAWGTNPHQLELEEITEGYSAVIEVNLLESQKKTLVGKLQGYLKLRTKTGEEKVFKIILQEEASKLIFEEISAVGKIIW